jgi:hypothetical protein
MRALPALATAVLLLAMPAAARADAVLDRLGAQSAGAPLVGFERTGRTESLDAKEGGSTVRVDRFDPKAPSGQQWTLLSVDGRAPSAKDLEQYRKANATAVPPGFHRLNRLLASPPAKRTELPGKTLYRWDGLPAGTIVTPGPDFSGQLSAEAIVEEVDGKPTLSQVRMFAARPFSIGGVARMNAFDVVSQYRPGQGGLPFLAAQTAASDVKAPFGMGGKRKSQFSFRPL